MCHPDCRARVRLRASLAGLLLLMAATPAAARGRGDLQRVIYEARSRVYPALVHIQPILEVFRSGERGKMAVTGSGVIISTDGYVLTNNHVVEGAQRLTCTLADQRELSARLVGRDPYTDLAVIQLDLSDLEEPIQKADLGTSADLEAGQFVIAMGSPLGLSRSISLGVISMVERYFPEARNPDGTLTGTFNTWIQTDAAINPGNSGGPLVNLAGQVVGINARAIPIMGENLGFAIPIDLAREVSEKLIAEGEVRRSWVGISWQHLEAAPGLAAAPDGKGALVASVVEGSPADGIGLQPGDVVVEIAGTEIDARHEERLPTLRKWISDFPIGAPLDISYRRDGRTLQATLTTAPLEALIESELEVRRWGFTARTISEEMSRQLRLSDRAGVLVTGVKPNSFAFEAGLRPGDVVRRVEGQEVPSLRVFEQLVQRLIEAEAARVLVEVQRGASRNFALLEPTYGPAAEGNGVPSGTKGETP